MLASIDQVPEELIDNAIVLGCLSFFVAFVFLIDLSEKMAKRRTDATQTDSNSIDRHYSKSLSMTTINSQANLVESDENNRRNRESMRSNLRQPDMNSQQTNPFVEQQPVSEPQRLVAHNGAAQQQTQPHQQQQFTEYHDQGFHSQPHSIHSTQQFPTTTYAEDVVETNILPTAQMPVFSKVKQTPMAVNHLESEPYKKILHRSNQPYTRYHDPAQHHHNDPSFYDDFNSYRQQTYYQGPKVDQGKLVIRDYSQHPHEHKQPCNCQNHQCGESGGHEKEGGTMKAGYVSQVAKLWDSRMKSNESAARSQPREYRNTNV